MLLKPQNQLYKNVDDILIRKGAKTTEVIPVNTLRNTLDDIRSVYTEGGMPEVLEVIPVNKLYNFH